MSVPIARPGLAVNGLDIVRVMLDRARRKSTGLPVRWVVAFVLGPGFRLDSSPATPFQQFLINADQDAQPAWSYGDVGELDEAR
jgi:hypothetical protein